MNRNASVWIFWLLLVTGANAFGQSIPLNPGHTETPIPTVTFELNWRQADPRWYLISVDSTGYASYRSEPRTEPNETPGDPFELRFTASEPTRTEVFQLAQQLNDFKGNFESKSKVAQTGIKTLTYRQGSEDNHTSLNYSDNPKMNELISLFQKMSTTFELSRKLDYDLRFDKLGLDRDLKSLEHLEAQHDLAELQVIAPTLERIVNDNAIMNIARQRARRLLEKSNAQTARK